MGSMNGSTLATRAGGRTGLTVRAFDTAPEVTEPVESVPDWVDVLGVGSEALTGSVVFGTSVCPDTLKPV